MGTRNLMKVALTLALLYGNCDSYMCPMAKETVCDRDLDDFHSRVYVYSSKHKKDYLCDTKTDEGGWIIIQRRVSQELSFDVGWKKYKNGFGNICGDHWLGLEYIHRITSKGLWELRIDMMYNYKFYYIVYTHFYIENEANKYRLRYKRSTAGNVEDMLVIHNGQYFSTIDWDNDDHNYEHCAKYYKSGWWFAGCHYTNLNGIYGNTKLSLGLNWQSITGFYGSLQTVEMKIREI